MFSDAGAKESESLSLRKAMEAVRVASEGGKRGVTQAGVQAASKAAAQSGGRVVFPMKYFGVGGSAVPLPQEFFGREPLSGGAAGKPGVAGPDDIQKAARAEGIKITPHGVKAAHKVAADYVHKTLKPLLRHDYPKASRWSAAQVRKASA